MQFLKKRIKPILLLFGICALSACSDRAHAPAFVVRAAAVEHGVLAAQLDWQPSTQLLDALDHGIALDFEIVLSAQTLAQSSWLSTTALARWRRELRYFPLTRQYQMRDPGLDRAHPDPTRSAETRTYAARALLIAAICDLRLDLPTDWIESASADGAVRHYRLRVDLQRDNLPGALRLPALFDADWRLSADYAWNP